MDPGGALARNASFISSGAKNQATESDRESHCWTSVAAALSDVRRTTASTLAGDPFPSASLNDGRSESIVIVVVSALPLPTGFHAAKVAASLVANARCKG